ncbi:MAG: hypothetical protein KAS12_01905, partial [Candidatus Aenigmarchaeota archaeon]|nr:hypothetical protein [Candidatus Aenigmarchaeota archaeon]
MYKIQFAGHLQDKDEILKTIQKKGNLEITKIQKDHILETQIKKKNILIESTATNLKNIEIIKKNLKENTLIEKYFKLPIKKNFNHLTDSAFDIWAKTQIDSILQKINTLKHGINTIEIQLKKDKRKLLLFNLFHKINTPLNNFSLSKNIITGIAETKKDNFSYLKSFGYIHKLHVKDKKTHIFFIIKKEHKEKAFSRLTDIELLEKNYNSIKPKEEIKKIRKNIEKNHYKLFKKRQKLKEISLKKPLILAIEEKYKNIKERTSKDIFLIKTKNIFFLEAWIAKKDLDTLKNLDICILSKKEFPDAPTKLENPKIIKSFERLTSLFALPKYQEFDPTPLIAITFPIFFGIMLTDIAYGFVLFLVSAVIWAKTHNETLKDYSIILTLSAISTILFGFVFGSFFGNLITMASPLNTYAQPIKIMIFSLLIGFAHINLGILLKLKSCKTKKEVLEPLSFIGLELGAIGAVGSYMTLLSSAWLLPSLVIFASAILFKLKKGYVGFMELTSLFSSWVSYVRLMALAVATGWIAFAINLGASVVSSGFGVLSVLIFTI